MKPFVLRILSVFAIALFLVSLTPGKVTAQSPGIYLDLTSGPAGAGFTFYASGFTPSQPAVIFWDESYAADAGIAKDGTSSGSFSVPGDAAPGDHPFTLCAPDTGCAESATAYFTVIDTKPTDTPVPVPAPMIYNFYLVPQTISAGDCSTLYWDVFDAQSVVVSGDFGSQSVDLSGNLKVCPPTTTTYTIRADGFKGAVPPSVSAGIILTVTTIVIDTPTFTPSRTPTKFPGYDNSPTFTPSRTSTKFPGYINTPTFTPSRTPTLTRTATATSLLFPPLAVIIPPADTFFSNFQFPVQRVPSSLPCGSLGLGTGTRVINFDDQASGRLTTQYPDVIFGTDAAFIGLPSVRTHSGTKAATSFFGDAGSVNHPIQMDFRNPVLAVGMYIGRETPSFYASQAIIAVLTGYGLNADGNMAALVENFLELPNSATPIDRCLTVRAPQGSTLRTARLEFVDNSGHSVSDPRWMDDLTYLPSNATVVDAPPTVRITQPFNAITISSESVYLLANITEDIGLSNVSASINGGPLESIGFLRSSTLLTTYQSSSTWTGGRFTARATNTIRIVATDTSGRTGEATVSFSYRPTHNTDIAVERLEITQSVQSMDSWVNGSNSVMLYNNRPTLVRVFTHTLSGPSPISGVGGAICPGHTGRYGCSNPLRPTAAIQVFSPSSMSYAAMRNEEHLQYTLNFILPMDWLRPGQWMEFTVYANYNQENLDELEYNNNYSEESFLVEAGQTLDVAPILLRINTYLPSDQSWQIIDGLYALFPVSNVRFITSIFTRGYIVPGTLDFAAKGTGCYPAWESILTAVSSARSADNYSGYVRYFGMVNATVASAGDVLGCGSCPGRIASGVINLSSMAFTKSVAAHEIAHNHGRRHSSMVNDAGDPDPESPFYYNASLEDGTMGIDVRAAHLYPASTSFDLMSYNDRTRRWASVYTYEALARAINSVAFIPPDNLHVAAQIKQTTDTGILMGAGAISPQGVTINGPFFTTTRNNPVWDDLPLGPYWMELQDASGKVLFSRNFGVRRTAETEPGDTGYFDFIVPTTSDVAAVVFKHVDTEIGRVTASPNKPEVTLISPNGGEQWGASEDQTIAWKGGDLDGDVLTYRLEYSPDGGSNWRLLAMDTRESSLTINTADLPGGNAILVRVLASDGLNTGMDTSDGPFAIAAKPPRLFVGNPQDEATLPEGWPVILHAYGTDLEDGPLPPETSFAWSSDRDGQMGNGEWLVASSENMSLGEHVITLTGTDSDGQASTYTTNITVTAGYTPPVKAKPLTPLWVIITAGVVAVGVVVAVSILVVIFSRRKKQIKP